MCINQRFHGNLILYTLSHLFLQAPKSALKTKYGLSFSKESKLSLVSNRLVIRHSCPIVGFLQNLQITYYGSKSLSWYLTSVYLAKSLLLKEEPDFIEPQLL